MYATRNIDDNKSFANEKTAQAAIEKALGKSKENLFQGTVILARNSVGRIVPILCNIAQDSFPRAMASGFLIVN